MMSAYSLLQYAMTDQQLMLQYQAAHVSYEAYQS